MMIGQVAALEPVWVSRATPIPLVMKQGIGRVMTPIARVALRVLMGACVGATFGVALGTAGFWVAVGMILGAGLGAMRER